jgi:hypothetical protein
MNKDLHMQYNSLSESISKLDFVTSQFMTKMQDVSSQIAAQFLKNKKSIKATKKFTPEIDQYASRDLNAYQDSLMHRFKSTYELTYQFLKFYAQEEFSIKSDTPQAILQVCLSNDLINNAECVELLKLFNDFELIFKENEREVSEDIIHYCMVMHKVVDRFKKN